MKADIQDRTDIRKLVSNFYQHLLRQEEFEHIFLQVAQIDILDHLDLLIDFWESVLFQTGKYKNNTMEVHVDLHQKYRLKETHFKEWIATFNETIDELFEGEIANRAKVRALSIATVIRMKISNLDRMRSELNN
ncbi:MAG: group III truncated hemoglobin [Bacteroidota bacterium]